MAEDRWRAEDHDLLIKIEERVITVQNDLAVLKKNTDLLMADRYKLIGGFVFAAFVVNLLFKLFWPKG